MKKKIMIAEDDIGIMEAMQFILEDAGYEVVTVKNGEIIRNMEKELPDLLLLDIWMSGMDGTAICKLLKSHVHTKHMPIIICSANKDTKKLSIAYGADGFLEKPFEMDDLLTIVKNNTNQ